QEYKGLKDAANAAKQAVADVGAASKTADAAAAQATQGFKVTGAAVREVGRGVQDFATGGVLGLSNNLGTLAQALGLGAGVAGAAEILGGILYLITPAVKAFFGSYEPKIVETFKDRVAELNAHIKELEDKKIKLAADWTEID